MKWGFNPENRDLTLWFVQNGGWGPVKGHQIRARGKPHFTMGVYPTYLLACLKKTQINEESKGVGMGLVKGKE